MSAKTRSSISKNWGHRHSSNPCRDRAAILRRPFTAKPRWFDILPEVSQYYDAILMQPIVSGLEYRIFLLDDEMVYSARKYPPFVLGDGIGSIRDLLIAHNEALRSRGLSPVAVDR